MANTVHLASPVASLVVDVVNAGLVRKQLNCNAAQLIQQPQFVLLPIECFRIRQSCD